jgi:hypothetical protein
MSTVRPIFCRVERMQGDGVEKVQTLLRGARCLHALSLAGCIHNSRMDHCHRDRAPLVWLSSAGFDRGSDYTVSGSLSRVVLW